MDDYKTMTTMKMIMIIIIMIACEVTGIRDLWYEGKRFYNVSKEKRIKNKFRGGVYEIA